MRGRRAEGQGCKNHVDDVFWRPTGRLYALLDAAADDLEESSRLDRLAMGSSGLCLVHCVTTAVLLGLVASAGGLLGRPDDARSAWLWQ